MADDSVQKTIISSSGAAKKEYDKGTLSFLDVDREIRIFNISEILVGREDVCDIRFDNSRISRKHAMVQLEFGGVKFVDLSSSNGSTRNGEKVNGTILLNDGDKLVLGKVFEFDVKIHEDKETIKSVTLKAGKTEYLLTQSEVLIGKNPSATDVTITGDPMIGTVHAQMEFMYNQAIMSALDNDRPIKVDGQPVKSIELKNYTAIQIGNTRLTWKC